MNVNTGDLYRVSSKEELEELKKAFGDALQPVPEEHSKDANAELGNKKHVVVDMKKDTPLANWAKQKRTQKSKRKMVKRSKRANR